jgi:oligogalacturonide transport system substrate-binding protein
MKGRKNMKKKQSVLYLLCVGLLAFSLLSGCGTAAPAAGTDSGVQASETIQATAAASGEPISLRFSWWGGDSRHQATLEALAKYHELNPNITIEGEYQGMDGYQQKMMTQLAGKTAPDIIQVDPPWLGNLAQSDLLMDIKGNADFDFTQFDQKIVDSFCSVNGKVLGLPSGTNGSAFVVNKAFLDKFGIDPNTQFTWDTFIEAGQRIHEQDPTAYLTAWDPVEAEYFVEEYYRMKTGQPWITDNFTINATKEDMTEAYTVLKKLYESGTSLPLGEVQPYISAMDQSPAWKSGKIGGYVDWISKLNMWKGTITDPVITMSVPVVKDGKDLSMRFRPAHIMSLNAATAYPAESSKFLNWFLNSPEAAAILKDCRSVPTSKSSQKTLLDMNLINADLKQAVDRTMSNPSAANPFVMGDAEIFSFLMDEFQNVAFGKHTPEQAAETLLRRTQEKLDALKTAQPQ